MDIKKLKAEFEKLKYIEEKLEYLNFDEHLGCYVEKSNGMPVGLAAWVNGALYGFKQAATAQAVPEGFVLVEKELSWVKADHLACAEWEKNKALFCTENRDITALQIEEYRLRWCKNKAHKIMSEYKAMIEAQEPAND
ncbi:hypothetical protein [Acinetobacter sp.]|uniref:hypothetical protein n=1 Tax=Acinetobacter sp. TaxID=472 RepID=UPI002580CB00|nr:hypothetical protein [Acinetobacter sp.]